MTVSTTHTKVIYQGDGTTRQWAYTFPIMKEDHIAIFITTKDGETQRVQSNYQVKPLQKQVIYPVTGKPLEKGFKIALLRKTPLTQELDLVNNGGFFPENIEQTFDRSVLVDQELLEQLERAVKMPETSNDNRDFAYEIIEARNRSEVAAQNSEAAQQGAEGHSARAEQEASKAEQEATRSKSEADRARQAADDAVTGGIRSVNGKQGNDIILTPTDIQAAEKAHSHELLDQVPAIKTENAGKSLFINADGTKAEWQMISGVPVGTIIAWGGITPPTGYFECAGQSLNRSIYKGLFTAIGTTWGSVSTETFRLPDFKNAARFLRSRGDGLEVGEVQGDAIRNIIGEVGVNNGCGLIQNPVEPLGAFKKGKSMTWTANGVANAGAYNLGLDISRIVPTADENRPKNAVVMYCIKAVDEHINPEQVDMADLVREIEERVRREEVQEIAGTRLWASDEYQPVGGIDIIATHNLKLDPFVCKYDILLVCKISEYGYSVGDIAMATGVTSPSGPIPSPLTPSLSHNQIQMRMGNQGGAGLTIFPKNSSYQYAYATPANWRLIFRIWY